jgi:uncharacterized protein YndB with AHSA1/START domain
MTDTGTLVQTAAGWDLVFVRPLDHPIDVVWQAMTDPTERVAWFPHRIEGEFVAGAPLRFLTELESLPELTGRVIEVDPPRLLVFSWGDDVLHFELAPTASGCTLTLRDSIPELGVGARNGAGWHVCLDQLAAALAGRVSAPAATAWPEVHPDYVAAFGPAAATVGPPS